LATPGIALTFIVIADEKDATRVLDQRNIVAMAVYPGL
jgi:hypothetical protein